MENREKLWSMLNPDKKFPPNADNFLMELCRQYPFFKLPFLGLNRLQADLFNAHLWNKADQIAANNREIARLFFRKAEHPVIEKTTAPAKPLSSEERKSRQTEIIARFLESKTTFPEPSAKKNNI